MGRATEKLDPDWEADRARALVKLERKLDRFYKVEGSAAARAVVEPSANTHKEQG